MEYAVAIRKSLDEEGSCLPPHFSLSRVLGFRVFLTLRLHVAASFLRCSMRFRTSLRRMSHLSSANEVTMGREDLESCNFDGTDLDGEYLIGGTLSVLLEESLDEDDCFSHNFFEALEPSD